MTSRRLHLSLLAILLSTGVAGAQTPFAGWPDTGGTYGFPHDEYVYTPGGYRAAGVGQDFDTWGPAAEWGPGLPAQEGICRLPGIEPSPAPADAKPDGGDATVDAPEDAAVVVEPQPEPPPKIWSGSFELGLDGSEGNSQRVNFRCGVAAKRKTDDDVFKLDLDYHKNTSHFEETAHRAFLDWRYEWLFKESPWTWFGHGTTDYDEFKAFDVRVAIDAGLGYQFLDTEKTSFLGRCGGGWSREVGSPEDDYVPEATFGSEFEHEFSPRQKLTASFDYTPDVSDFRDFRFTTKAGWEFLLDEQMNLSLKLSLLDRYDSTPNGAKANDVDYSVTLLWKY